MSLVGVNEKSLKGLVNRNKIYNLYIRDIKLLQIHKLVKDFVKHQEQKDKNEKRQCKDGNESILQQPIGCHLKLIQLLVN